MAGSSFPQLHYMNEAPDSPAINHASSIEVVSSAARLLSGSLEAVTGSVYFAPECHANYVALGFAPSVNKAGEVQLPDGPKPLLIDK